VPRRHGDLRAARGALSSQISFGFVCLLLVLVYTASINKSDEKFWTRGNDEHQGQGDWELLIKEDATACYQPYHHCSCLVKQAIAEWDFTLARGARFGSS
jgi:hypothetical protein